MDFDNKSVGGLVINEDVISKMASTAAMEIGGVSGMANRAGERGLFRGGGMKPVKVSFEGGQTVIDVSISVKHDVRITDVAEAVQRNVKETVQNMTGSAVSKVNVHIMDIDLKSDDAS